MSVFVHDVLRSRLLERAGLIGHHRQAVITIDELYRTQWSNAFEQYMRNRLVMGWFRYGGLRTAARRARPHDHVRSAIRHLHRYVETGNQEHLVDAANLCLVEFVLPACHEKPYFRSVDDGVHVPELK